MGMGMGIQSMDHDPNGGPPLKEKGSPQSHKRVTLPTQKAPDTSK